MRQGVPADQHGPPASTAQTGATRAAGARAPSREAVDRLLADSLLRAVRGTSAYGGVVYLRSPDRRSLVLSTVVGIPLHVIDGFRRIPVAAPLPAAEAHRTGRTVILADAEETMRRFPRMAVGLPYSYASASVPLASADHGYGALMLLWPGAAGGPPPGIRRQLRTVANRLAGGLAAFGEEIVAGPEPKVLRLPPPTDQATLIGSLDWEPATGRLSADEELSRILGLGPEEFDGRWATLVARLAPDDVRSLRAAARAALRDGRPFSRQVQVRDHSGGYRTVELRGRVPLGSGHLVVTVLDSTAGSAAAAAVERLRDGVFALHPDGRVAYVNRSAELHLGARRSQLIGRHPWETLPWLTDPVYEDRYRAAMVSQQPTAFLARRPPDHWLAFSLYPDSYGVTGRVVPAAPSGEHLDALPEAPPATPPRPGAFYHLLQLASALTEAVTVREVSACVIEQILPGFGGQELALYLARDGRMHLVSQSGYPTGFLDSFEGIPIRSRLPGTEVFSSGAPIFFESPRELLAAYPGIPRDEMCAWAFLPLVASGHPVGSCILGFDHPRAFTAEERSVLTALGGLIAQALERARLYDAEFALARGLQQALLPHRLPAVPGLTTAARYLPGTQGMEIGGDWYDAVTTPMGLCLVIGDVEGHNVGAAATMGQLRSAVRAFASGGAAPDEVLARTNQLLLDLDAGLLASCCLLRIDPATGRAEGVRAGHLPPLLRHPGGRTEVLALEGGPLLGIDGAVQFPVTEFWIPSGAVLALYTDGLVEDPGSPIELGIDRLRTSLAHDLTGSLDALADRLVGDASGSSHRADDVALLLAGRD
ncbi:SpoIIE family protein phosphatase [Kitasatospora sp. NPDC088346]|uniref:SpoIIE family protein phosphatase n=1 Tax=Kitasatospora sp. NPDC088346 TaxID=3364073 RepID=UPI0037F9110C